MRWMPPISSPLILLLLSSIALANNNDADVARGWRIASTDDNRRSMPKDVPADAKAIEPGAEWPNDNKFRWLIADLAIPATIEGKPSAGQPVGLQFDCGDGGEVWVDGSLQTRFDNDHPALVVIADQAEPGKIARVAVQVYGKVQGGDRFGTAKWVLIDRARAIEPLQLTIDASKLGADVPNGIVGLSQGGGMSDYEPATAAKLREGGFKWFRMDNVLTTAAKKGADGQIEYDFSELDKRTDFMYAIGAEPIMAASYMPQVFDAVPNGERQSAPADYAAWEELCARAAKHSLDRGRRVPMWEVWNETNAGWLKPGPSDTGSDAFVALLKEASGKEPKDKEVARRLEAYCKLYRATANGVRRGDPQAKVGGPALASGPYDEGGAGPGVHGQTFARGLMLYCDRERLPLDFLSWHEYFQPSDVIAAQARTFRKLAADVPSIKDKDLPLIVTEWNEAWWPDRPHDHEVGAAWCADGLIRAFIPERAQPCLFYAKQGGEDFRGDWSILMSGNRPKATYNVAKIFNQLSGKWLNITGTDNEISAVASLDASTGRLRLIAVNFQPRYNVRRPVRLSLTGLPPNLASGTWREWTIDATHSNTWHDPAKAELQQTGSGSTTTTTLDLDRTLKANSVLYIELSTPDTK